MPVSTELERNEKLARLATIKNHPAWDELADHYRELFEKEALQTGTGLLHGAVSNDRHLALRAGYWRGVFQVLEAPGKAETRLAKAIEEMRT